MCIPSATRAIEPNIRPPPISASIIAPQSQITAHVLRSLFSWPSPRNTWVWRCGVTFVASLIWASFQVGANNFNQVCGASGALRINVGVGVHNVVADVIFHHLDGQALDGPT